MEEWHIVGILVLLGFKIKWFKIYIIIHQIHNSIVYSFICMVQPTIDFSFPRSKGQNLILVSPTSLFISTHLLLQTFKISHYFQSSIKHKGSIVSLSKLQFSSFYIIIERDLLYGEDWFLLGATLYKSTFESFSHLVLNFQTYRTRLLLNP